MIIRKTKHATKILKFRINAVQNDEFVAGTGCIIIDFKPKGPTGIIEDIFVNEDFRKQGIASEIVKALITIAREYNCYKVVLSCEDSLVDMYKKLGFRKWQNALRMDL